MKSFIKRIILLYKFRKNNIIEKNVIIAADTVIHGDSFIGANSNIGPRVQVCRNVKIGRNVRLSNINVGENSFIESEVICTGYGNGQIKIGKECYVGIRSILDWSDDITIGDYVHIASSTGLWTHSSAKMCLNSIPLSRQNNKEYRLTAPIEIENNVYIGSTCTIYPGIKIGHHAIIAPNSAVSKDVPPYTMFGGVPAKLIKKLK